MNEDEKPKEQTDELGQALESENEVNAAIEQQGDDAAAGIPRDTDAAKHQKEKNEDNEDLQGAP
jgi:hypothetical protein